MDETAMVKLVMVIVFGALTLSGCAGPTYTTTHGLRVFDNTLQRVPRHQVERITSLALGTTPDREINLHGVTVFFHSRLIEIQRDDRTTIVADGFADPRARQIIASTFTQCLAASSLTHELGHIIHDEAFGNPDPTHRDLAFWSEIDAIDHDLEKTQCTAADIAEEELARRAPGSATLAEGSRAH